MSDLDPSPQTIDIPLTDPAVTRLVDRSAEAAAGQLLTRLAPVATSISFVAPVDVARAMEFLRAVRLWRPEALRVEVISPTERDDARSGPSTGGQADHVPWRPLRRPMGGRAAVLAASAEVADHEFVVVSGSPRLPLQGMVAALGHMWAEGCDAALVGSADGAGRSNGAARQTTDTVDAAAELASWLGLGGSRVPERLVVLRRWVARWLFNEVTRAIDPWEEIADRARLLGIGIVRLATSDASAPSAEQF